MSKLAARPHSPGFEQFLRTGGSPVLSLLMADVDAINTTMHRLRVVTEALRIFIAQDSSVRELDQHVIDAGHAYFLELLKDHFDALEETLDTARKRMPGATGGVQ
jgi:hypothetical protein